MLLHMFFSVHGKKKPYEGQPSMGKVLGKDKPPAAGGAGSLPAASPPDHDNNSRDFSLDSKPKKGIIFEICSEDGFHIRSESIEGEKIPLYKLALKEPVFQCHAWCTVSIAFNI